MVEATAASGCLCEGTSPLPPWVGDRFLLSLLLLAAAGRALNAREIYANSVIDFYRSRIEQFNLLAKQPWNIMGNGKWRGSVQLLEALVTIVLHSRAYELRTRRPVFQPVGPWSHDPALFV